MNHHRVDYLSRDKLAWLLVTQALVILPLLFFLPGWLLVIWGLVAYWRIQMYLGRWGAPGMVLKGIVIGLCALGIFISFSGRVGTETMVALLLSAFVLKLLEVKSNRDAQWLIMIGFVTTGTQLLFNQSPLAALYSLGCCWLLIASWRAIHLHYAQPMGKGLRRSGAILLHTLPVMLVLFVVIPRLGPLWAIPNQKAAQTGFSDSLEPGDISELVTSQAPAFRVEFEGEPLAPTRLYWRGLVMDHFDGRRWTQRDKFPLATKTLAPNDGKRTNYSIIIEPHGQRWLFGLVTPVRLHTGAHTGWITDNNLLMMRYPIAQRLRYEVSSVLDSAHAGPFNLSSPEQQQHTQFPAGANPRTQALIRDWRRQGADNSAIIERALKLFNQQFRYTLRPPALGQHSVDEFLFDTKQGFCEHFASSFAFMLRSAGIPARIAVGYQGGMWNNLENYLLVRQSDAHAWVEVWSAERGWYMIDPTATVAPNRIEQGINNALPDTELNLVQSPWQHLALLRQLQMQLDAAVYLWHRRVLSYDAKAQEGLLKNLLGGNEPWRITLWLIGLGLITAGIFAWLMARRRRWNPLRPETRLIQRLERKLAPRGFTRARDEPLGQFLARVAHAEPPLQQRLQEICRLYEQIAYREQDEYLDVLRQAIKKI